MFTNAPSSSIEYSGNIASSDFFGFLEENKEIIGETDIKAPTTIQVSELLEGNFIYRLKYSDNRGQNKVIESSDEKWLLHEYEDFNRKTTHGKVYFVDRRNIFEEIPAGRNSNQFIKVCSTLDRELREKTGKEKPKSFFILKGTRPITQFGKVEKVSKKSAFGVDISDLDETIRQIKEKIPEFKNLDYLNEVYSYAFSFLKKSYPNEVRYLKAVSNFPEKISSDEDIAKFFTSNLRQEQYLAKAARCAIMKYMILYNNFRKSSLYEKFYGKNKIDRKNYISEILNSSFSKNAKISPLNASEPFHFSITFFDKERGKNISVNCFSRFKTIDSMITKAMRKENYNSLEDFSDFLGFDFKLSYPFDEEDKKFIFTTVKSNLNFDGNVELENNGFLPKDFQELDGIKIKNNKNKKGGTSEKFTNSKVSGYIWDGENRIGVEAQISGPEEASGIASHEVYDLTKRVELTSTSGINSHLILAESLETLIDQFLENFTKEGGLSSSELINLWNDLLDFFNSKIDKKVSRSNMQAQGISHKTQSIIYERTKKYIERFNIWTNKTSQKNKIDKKTLSAEELRILLKDVKWLLLGYIFEKYNIKSVRRKSSIKMLSLND